MRLDYATNSLLVRREVEPVFHFVARGAQYTKWHFGYHLRAKALDIRPRP